MQSLKTFLKILFMTACIAAVPACQKSSGASSDKNVLKVGAIAGPEAQLMEVAKQVARKKYNLNIEIVPFTDYTMPNEALSDGSIDANMFQHTPYLEEAIKKRGYEIVAIGRTFIYPIGAYSKKITQIQQLQDGATVAIPNDPSNEARALLLLKTAGLITLKPGSNVTATLNDIVTNPKKLKFKEIDAAQLPRSLPDVDLAVINTNYAMSGGLLPSRDAIIIESRDSPYANLIVVRKADENAPWAKKLVEALHSDEVLEEAEKLFKDQAVPAWKQ